MIKNERQYKVTRAQLERFEMAATSLSLGPRPSNVHPALRSAEESAIRSQIAELREEIAEYESLRSGDHTVFALDSIDDLPTGLIRARIASGITHKELAQRLGVPEQQVQRYEATDYSTLTLPRLAEVARALGVSVREDLFLPTAKVSTETLLDRLSQLGFDRQFIRSRFLTSHRQVQATGDATDDSVALRAAALMRRVLGISLEDLFSTREISLRANPALAARFKKTRRGKTPPTDAYVLYAHYMALLVLQATPSVQAREVPTEAIVVRDAIVAAHGKVTFESALRYAWSLGVVVLPLSDPGAFHGAFWRVNGRNVIVLKQLTSLSSRWLFDLLHELFHASQEPQLDERSCVEVGDVNAPGKWADVEEQHAMQFASDVVLNGQASLLAQECVSTAGGLVERLKSSVETVANKHSVDAGSLANYIAFRLSNQEPQFNWWGAAHNMQTGHDNPYNTAVSVLLEFLELRHLSEPDRDLVKRALCSNVE